MTETAFTRSPHSGLGQLFVVVACPLILIISCKLVARSGCLIHWGGVFRVWGFCLFLRRQSGEGVKNTAWIVLGSTCAFCQEAWCLDVFLFARLQLISECSVSRLILPLMKFFYRPSSNGLTALLLVSPVWLVY